MLTVDKNDSCIRRSSEEYILLTICACTTFAIAPFAAIRLLGQEWLLAGIDSFLVMATISLGLFVWQKRKVRLASFLLAIFCMAGLLAVVHLKGPSLLYWAHPVMVITFFLLRPREAVIIDLLTMTALMPVLLPHIPKMELATVLVTMLLSMVSAYIFANLTRKQHQRLKLLATKDSLTGAGNRRAFDVKINEVLVARQRNRQAVSLLVVDLDFLKAINDTFGHATGDKILCQVTNIILKMIRATDSLYRIGGDEFVVIAMDANLAAGITLAEKLRQQIDESALLAGRSVTISVGVVEINEGETGMECLKLADNALYEAKKVGRNRVCTAQRDLPRPLTFNDEIVTSHHVPEAAGCEGSEPCTLSRTENTYSSLCVGE